MRHDRRSNLCARIASAARQQMPVLASQLFPRGHTEGREWAVGNLKGEPGNSLKIVLVGPKAGLWKDFATGEGGRDAVSLVAAVEGIGQAEAARHLAKMMGVFHE
ncbi:MAG: hypothetical protein HYU59_09045 [Magnetospirillum gryphiswaldense]|uniref:Toprim domain-containing protein n=1 Tax=Magnetospirillum sulfuroxidans TaxID=611300 RepID=A0ABS5III7_9PROT|nr:hypothetical protein [Magnetospirillum sulfuroxidans]MBI2240932.1 hypothetical protein [Magnetospirillum gryphiswaldense]MBR9973583.1 hypothetical protein [Magnetospirillum sulfuroxidans]